MTQSQSQSQSQVTVTDRVTVIVRVTITVLRRDVEKNMFQFLGENKHLVNITMAMMFSHKIVKRATAETVSKQC